MLLLLMASYLSDTGLFIITTSQQGTMRLSGFHHDFPAVYLPAWPSFRTEPLVCSWNAALTILLGLGFCAKTFCHSKSCGLIGFIWAWQRRDKLPLPPLANSMYCRRVIQLLWFHLIRVCSHSTFLCCRRSGYWRSWQTRICFSVPLIWIDSYRCTLFSLCPPT